MSEPKRAASPPSRPPGGVRGIPATHQPFVTGGTKTAPVDDGVSMYLCARVAPDRVVPPTGPAAPTLDVEWRFVGDEPSYRIHYADSNTGFNCGWHRDDDHPTLGPVHFQYEHPVQNESDHEPAQFQKTVPTEVLWTALDRLFEDRIPTLSGADSI